MKGCGKGARRNISIWRKNHKLGTSDYELDFAYAEIIPTAMEIREEQNQEYISKKE
ncbi:hypothetical protein [Sporosarcina sp. Te-1]|uniref:hypothetical protein n=1 Tax=Sporosarcina sp. Te-1 TaxID=2818390 RepID=UPI001A9E4C44|nr:hypothetical protein [Sporosarcina sp. Te-1]QTD40523.1 hypothetical protein J3U78_17400 [Sporosarcina sp. Te-1]